MSDERWPSLPLAEWQDTYATLHMWTQIIGKIRLALTPLINHWWNVPLYVTARGLTTLPMPCGRRIYQIDFDFVDHQLVASRDDGTRDRLQLRPMSVAEFYRETMAMLGGIGLNVKIWPVPVEVQNPIPFLQDHDNAAYDPNYANRFWRILTQAERVFTEFRSRFIGKCSPVHFFWGAVDLAYTRFSGRTAPPHPGGAPNCGPHVMWEAYSHEVSSCGYWPGGPGEEGCFYAYAYPDPPGYREAPVGPDGARWDDDLGEFVLPYELMRTATDPDAALLEFLQSTYEAAATTAAWDRDALERPADDPDDR